MGPSAELFQISQVFQAPCSSLVLYQRIASDKRNVEVRHPMCDSLTPSILEFDSAEPSEQIDSPGRKTQLDDHLGGGKVCFGNSESLEWGAKILHSLPDFLDVLAAGRDPDVEVSCGPRDSVDRQSMGTDH